MLVSMKAVLSLADAKKITVGAFNTTPLEGIQVVLGAAKELRQPIILQFAPVHESIIPLRVIRSVMVVMAERSPVPVCVRLDHGDKLEIPQEAPETGFISAVYDGSVLPLEGSVANTKIVVEMVGSWGVSVEVEPGAMGRQEFLSAGEDEEGEAMESCYTDPEQAWTLTVLTGVDALACSFSTVRGLYLTTLKLDPDRIRRIRESIGIPIVMHDGPGVSDEDFKKYIANGVRKTSYHTYLAKAGGMYVKEKCADVEEYIFLHDVTQQAVQVMKKDVLRIIKVFSYLE